MGRAQALLPRQNASHSIRSTPARIGRRACHRVRVGANSKIVTREREEFCCRHKSCFFKLEVDAPRSLLEKRRRWLALLTGRRNLTLDNAKVIGEGGPVCELQ